MKSQFALAQQNTTDVLINKLYLLWDSHYLKYNVDHLSGEPSDAYSMFKNSNPDQDKANLNYTANIKLAESELYKKDWGLGWNTNFLLNSAPGMEMADNIIYRSRVQTELRWDVLNSGYFENKTKAQIKENEAFISQLEFVEDSKKQQLFIQWHAIIYQFNTYKIELLDVRLELSKSRVETAYKLYDEGMISQEEMLKNVESYAEIKSLLKIYKDYNDQLSSTLNLAPSYSALPLIDVNYTYTVNQLKAAKNDTLVALMLKNIELEQKRINTINVGVFSRYNFYDNPTAASNRSFFTFGLNVGVPLVFDKKEKADYYQVKKEQIVHEIPEEGIQMQKDVLTYFYEYRYKLKQFNNFYYKSLLLKELLRKEQARHEIDPLAFNPLKALRNLDDLMSIDIELIDLKQQMYLYLLRMYMAIPNASINTMITPLTLESLVIEAPKNTADEVYIWSKTLHEHSPKFIAEYCVKQNYKKVVLSLGGAQNILEETTKELTASGIVVDLMIGNNNLINESTTTYLTERVKPTLKPNIKGIHLDVEPHVNADWSQNKEAYMAKYVAMVKEARTYCDQKDLTLSISIPLHYPKETIDVLYTLVDQVYFMCYENIKTDYIVKKTAGFDPYKTTIALRTEDFKNSIELKSKIEELTNLIVVKGFIIHDLGRLIKLDN